jgi:hypothetical protein
VKALLRKFRLPRKLVSIVGGGALLVSFSGAAALYFGKQKLMDVASASTNGLECSDVNLVTIRKQDHVWIRKYIKTEPTDGLTRVTTALRVAKAIYDAHKPDLVQVVVLDKNGPTLRADIRGRALGADVVYVPNPAAIGEDANESPITARYFNGAANDAGLFYGERIDMQPQDIANVMATLKDVSDCADPVAFNDPQKGEEKKEHKKKGADAPEPGGPSPEHTGSIASQPDPDTLSASAFTALEDGLPPPIQPMPPPASTLGMPPLTDADSH